jgi:hypothetical protein
MQADAQLAVADHCVAMWPDVARLELMETKLLVEPERIDDIGRWYRELEKAA